MLIGMKPKSTAEAAVLARARQATDFVWTPICDVPTFIRAEGATVLPAGKEIKGFPYSSTERKDKFLPENVSFESFLTAIANPHSKLYQPGHGALNACNYGIVCNSFVRYAFGIVWRVNTKNWYRIPGMREVKPKGCYTLDDLCLCDILHAYGEGSNHVALITDILRREDGTVAEVEVSEAVRPSCIRATYTPEVFFEKYKLFGLCRYDLIESVPPFDEQEDRLLFESGLDKILPAITVDNGMRSNYLEGEEVILSVFADEPDTVELLKNGELLREIKVARRAAIPLSLERGYYTARLKQDGRFVEFCVNRAEISFEVHDGCITVHADSNDAQSELVYADFRGEGKEEAALVKFEELSEEERRAYRFTREIPDGAKHFKVYYRNAYGIWTHRITRI